jgi:hypothetical protein
MGLRITVPGADFSKSAVAFDAAVKDGLKGLWFFNDTPERSRINLVPGSQPAVLYGSPVQGAGFNRFKGGSDYLDTLIPETVEQTYMMAVRTDAGAEGDADDGVMFVSTYGAPGPNPPGLASFGSAMYKANNVSNALAVSGTRYADDAQTSTTSAGRSLTAIPSSWQLVMGRVRDTRAEVDNFTTPNVAATNFTAPPRSRVPNGATFRIGSGYSAASYLGEAEIAFMAIWNRFISNAERDAMKAQIAPIVSRFLGVTV